jgi:hypothetical protein
MDEQRIVKMRPRKSAAACAGDRLALLASALARLGENPQGQKSALSYSNAKDAVAAVGRESGFAEFLEEGDLLAEEGVVGAGIADGAVDLAADFGHGLEEKLSEVA